MSCNIVFARLFNKTLTSKMYMNINIRSLALTAVLACVATTCFAAKEKITASPPPLGSQKPVIAVAEFKNETNASWWSSSVGKDLAGLLSNELAATNQFRVVERQKMNAIIEEQNLMASGRAKLSNAAQMGKLFGAQYLVMGTVTSYEEQAKSSGSGLSFGGISVGGKSAQAYVAVDIRVVDTTTGEIAFVRTIEGNSKSGGSNLSFSKFGASGETQNEENKPAGKAIRAAIVMVSSYLECVMVSKDGCEATFDQQDKRRRKKTAETLNLD
jgi:curli biogenesis system outer membrane secretion channel CsgG